ncbi:phage tail terminator protein [Xenorhabdus thuongxuanensis]|uniref:Phage tail protein n=1 Tax=Xenorhabdus thuongxuanensis TaxID=1873484 RepID=A0A1Q5U3R7_9GAMM|nr:phage tail terminator protein [Xenorhabdus thuongxuanensis]OKP07121.1 hypothetical protein Xentx_01725 [Xenorhabdus thuongxuanensis]
MSKHSTIRQAVIAALAPHANGATVFDGRPFFVDEQEFPAIAVYLTEAQSTDNAVDEDQWQVVLHIELFLKASQPDSELDKWVENTLYPALRHIPALSALIDAMSPIGYDYQRDDDMGLWGSVDLSYQLIYSM